LRRWVRRIWIARGIIIDDNSRRWKGRLLRMRDLTTSTEFDHVESAFFACDEMSAGNKHDLAWGRKAEETF